MTPASQKLLNDTKKVVDDALSTLLRDVDRGDTYEVLEKFADHLDNVRDRAEGHIDALEDEDEELDDEEEE